MISSIILSYDEEEAYISTNSGDTFSSIVTPLDGVLPEYQKYTLNYDGSVILIFNDSQLYKSINFGTTWESLEDSGSLIEDVSISYDGQIIALTTSDDGGSWNHGLVISLDSGLTWMYWDAWLLSPSGYNLKQIKVSGDGSKIYAMEEYQESIGSAFISIDLENVIIHVLVWKDAFMLSRPE